LGLVVLAQHQYKVGLMVMIAFLVQLHPSKAVEEVHDLLVLAMEDRAVAKGIPLFLSQAQGQALLDKAIMEAQLLIQVFLEQVEVAVRLRLVVTVRPQMVAMVVTDYLHQ
jgi:hypothetical protein